MMRRYPFGVSVVTVDLDGERLGLTVASLSSLALEPPLVGVSVARQAALHELLRSAGGFAVSMLAADQIHLAQHFARGVPPIALWQGVETRDGGVRRSWRARSAGSSASSTPSTQWATTRSSWAGSSEPSPAATARPCSASAATTAARDRGRRLRSRRRHRRLRAGLGRRARAARARARRALARRRPGGHDGHELARVVAVHARGARARGDAAGAERRGRETPARAVRDRLAADRRRGRGRPPPRRRLSARGRVVVEPAGDRDRARRRRDRDLFAATVSSEEVERGKPAPDVYLEAARRLALEPSSCAAVEDSSNGLRAASAAGLRVIAIPNRHYPPAADALGPRRRRARLARRAQIRRCARPQV